MNKIDELSVKSIRFLAAEAVEKAKSGHPGLAIDAAPMAYTLWKQMKHNPKDPEWQGRDRFVLSAGHASVLEYSLLHLFGYGLTIEDLKNFRQWGSLTPGHPEYRHTKGVETTSGPLGQGIAIAVGMAMAESRLAAHFNRDGYKVVDNYTYALCGDGCLQEGVASEAASMAGTMGLGKLILIYDRNHITIEGRIESTFGENVKARFEAYGWQVQEVASGENMDAIQAALDNAKADTEHPSLIIVNTEIGYGTAKQGKASAHGEPLGEEALKSMREFYHWDYAPFEVPGEVYAHFEELGHGYAKAEEEYDRMFEGYKAAYPELYAEWVRWHDSKLPEELLNDPRLTAAEKPMATRATSGEILNLAAEYMPNLFGGSADLAPSNKSELKGKPYYSKNDRNGSNVHFGIREFAMAAACNGIMLYGGLRPYCATFMVFSDYLKPAMRMAALMKLPVLYILTHDSIGVGEDGPTHQPIEHLSSLRALPGLYVFRPCDANENISSWKTALALNAPSAFVCSRQGLETLEISKNVDISKGAYKVVEKAGAKITLMASGSEVHTAIAAARILENDGIAASVVSVPCFDLFVEAGKEYHKSLLGDTKVVAVEAASGSEWYRFADDVICMESFGASGKDSALFKEFGFTAENVAARAKILLS